MQPVKPIAGANCSDREQALLRVWALQEMAPAQESVIGHLGHCGSQSSQQSHQTFSLLLRSCCFELATCQVCGNPAFTWSHCLILSLFAALPFRSQRWMGSPRLLGFLWCGRWYHAEGENLSFHKTSVSNHGVFSSSLLNLEWLQCNAEIEDPLWW